LGKALNADRDLQFGYLGLQTLYDRYFLHIRNTRIELPQVFFMRVAMGLALGEKDREARAIEFYEILSSFDFMSLRTMARASSSSPLRPSRAASVVISPSATRKISFSTT
jgi:ribonucleotide reductase alpha subunit